LPALLSTQKIFGCEKGAEKNLSFPVKDCGAPRPEKDTIEAVRQRATPNYERIVYGSERGGLHPPEFCCKALTSRLNREVGKA
jgi:hypothetical protein